MPIDLGTGQYTPISAGTKQDIVRYLTHIPGLSTATNSELYLSIGGRFNVDQNDQLVLQGLIATAKRAVAAGDTVTHDPTTIIGEDIVPDVPHIEGETPQWTYDVVIEIIDPTTHGHTFFSDRLDFPNAMSEADILAYINANRDEYILNLSPVTYQEHIADRLTIDITVRSVVYG